VPAFEYPVAWALSSAPEEAVAEDPPVPAVWWVPETALRTVPKVAAAEGLQVMASSSSGSVPEVAAAEDPPVWSVRGPGVAVADDPPAEPAVWSVPNDAAVEDPPASSSSGPAAADAGDTSVPRTRADECYMDIESSLRKLTDLQILRVKCLPLEELDDTGDRLQGIMDNVVALKQAVTGRINSANAAEHLARLQSCVESHQGQFKAAVESYVARAKEKVREEAVARGNKIAAKRDTDSS
jgi:hypothetical protein